MTALAEYDTFRLGNGRRVLIHGERAVHASEGVLNCGRLTVNPFSAALLCLLLFSSSLFLMQFQTG